MAYDRAQLLALRDEIKNDPLKLGYDHFVSDIVFKLVNQPGTASVQSRVGVPSENPVLVGWDQVFNTIGMVDGYERLVQAINWVKQSDDPLAVVCRFLMLDLRVPLDVASPAGRQLVDRISSKGMLSKEASESILGLGVRLMSRARELCGQPATLTDVELAMGMRTWR